MQVLISVSKTTVRCAGSHREHIIAQLVAYAASVLIITALGYASSTIQSSTSLIGSLSYQLGNCVTTGRLKGFLSLLGLTSVTVPLASLPILPVLRTHVVAALTASHADAWATAYWWNRVYSWIFCGGPAGRWVVGTLLGFRVLREGRVTEPSWFSGSVMAQPHARVVILVGFATLMWLFAVVRNFFRCRAIILNRHPSIVGHDSFCCYRRNQRPDESGQRSLYHIGKLGPHFHPLRVHSVPVFGCSRFCWKHVCCPLDPCNV
jgi:hypothetical protein